MNSSKTEFLLIGLTKQLAKTNNSSLTTTHSARIETSASCLMNTSPFLTRSHLSPNHAAITSIFVSFAVFVHAMILKQPPPSPLPLFTPSLTFFITTWPSLRSPGRLYNRSKIVLHVLLSKLPNLVTTPILRSVHWLKITERM